MFHTILVAVDRTDVSQAAFEVALALAQIFTANLILLNVLSPDDEARPNIPVMIGQSPGATGLSRSMTTMYTELWQSYCDRELAWLRSLAEKAAATGVDTTFHQSLGDSGPMICKFAQDLQVDLTVVGRRDYSPLDELILGSVSNYVLHHAPCSVLMVR